MNKFLMAILLTSSLTTPALSATIPAGDYIQWYSGTSYFDFPNQTFEYADDIVLPTNATGAFAPFNQSTSLTPFYGDGLGVDIPIGQLGSGVPFEQASLNGLTAAGVILSTPMTIFADTASLFITAGACSISLTGFDVTQGLCGISTGAIMDPRAPAGWWTGYGFVSNGNPVVVPAPIIGTGISGILMLIFLRKFLKQSAPAKEEENAI